MMFEYNTRYNEKKINQESFMKCLLSVAIVFTIILGYSLNKSMIGLNRDGLCFYNNNQITKYC